MTSPAYLSIDFGGSTIDVIHWQKKLASDPKVLKIQSFERDRSLKDPDLKTFLQFSKLKLNHLKKIYVTGGKSHTFPQKIENIPILKIPEIEAIAKGGWYFLHHDENLKTLKNTKNLTVVSMGTGTCIVELKLNKGSYFKSTHIGGTGVGGGTFLGLCQSLLGETDIKKLKKLFQRGDKNKVDLSVGEIIGSGIGKVPASSTASNLAKLNPQRAEINFSEADLASGIVNLIGQTIAIVSIFAAKGQKSSAIVLTGKLTRIEKILDIIIETANIYKVPVFIPKNAAYVSALGAGMLL